VPATLGEMRGCYRRIPTLRWIVFRFFFFFKNDKNPENLEKIKGPILEEKALDFILSKVKLKEIEMSKISSDILFSKIKKTELITLNDTAILKQNIEKYEQMILKNLYVSELTQVIINRLIFLGIDLNKFALNHIKTPSEFSNFLHKLSKFHKDLRN